MSRGFVHDEKLLKQLAGAALNRLLFDIVQTLRLKHNGFLPHLV